jgi:excisionase family DNA binding protein
MNLDKKPSTPTALLDYGAAQSYLGEVSRSTVKALAANGELRVVRIGRRTMFRRDDLDKYIDRRIIASENPMTPRK